MEEVTVIKDIDNSIEHETELALAKLNSLFNANKEKDDELTRINTKIKELETIISNKNIELEKLNKTILELESYKQSYIRLINKINNRS